MKTTTQNSASEKVMVSVTVLVYNSAAHLTEALECLTRQTFKDFEVILFDDHSTDASSDICRDLAARDRRIRHVLPPRRLGLQASRSAVLNECAGHYVAVLDSDDLCEPTRLEKQIACVSTDQKVVLVTSLCGRVGAEGRKTAYAETPHLDGAALLWRLLLGNSIFHSSVMFSRSLALKVGGYNPELTTCEDADLYGRLLEHGKVRCINEILSYWRVHANNISRGIDHYQLKRKDALGVFHNLIKKFTNLDVDLDTLEALYVHVRTAAVSAEALRQAMMTVARIFDALTSDATLTLTLTERQSLCREALLTLADIQKTNVTSPYWAEVTTVWHQALAEMRRRFARDRYHWFTDLALFYPRRQLPIRMALTLCAAPFSKVKPTNSTHFTGPA